MTTNKIEIAKISTLEENQPTHALVKNTDLVITKPVIDDIHNNILTFK